MALSYALLFVVFLPYGNFLEIIKNSNFIRLPQQITTSFQNVSTTEYPGVKWWTLDEISYNTSETNQTNLNSHTNETGNTNSTTHPNPEDLIDTIYLTPENVDSVLQTLTLPSMKNLKRRRKPFSFTVEGIVGSGKSTLLSTFKVMLFVF